MRYPHILERVIGTPLAIEASKLAILNEEVFLKLFLEQSIDRSVTTPEAPKIISPEGVYVLAVHGSLANKNAAGGSGMTTYEGLMAETKAAINAGFKVIGLDISSGGGEALGMFEFGNFWASLPEKYGVQTFAYTNSNACSAAYGLMAASQKVFAVDSAIVGSIGVVMSLFSSARAEEKAGIDWLILRSKEEKALNNPHEKISAEVIADAKNKLAIMDEKFNSYIAKVRPQLTLEKIVSLKGNTMFADAGVEFGLVDAIVTSMQDVYDFYAARPEKKLIVDMKSNSSIEAKSCTTKQSKGKTLMTLEEALIALQEAQVEADSLKASISLEKLKAQKSERTRCLALFQSGIELKIPNETIMQAISNEFSLEQAAVMFSGIKASADAITTANLNTTAPAPNAVQAAAHLQTALNAAGNVNLYDLMGLEKATDVKLAGGALSVQDVVAQMQTFSQDA